MTEGAVIEKRKFSAIDKWAYAAGDFGCNMSFALKNLITIFYTLYIGLDAGIVAIIILILNIWDGVNDPIVGAIMDNFKPKKGKSKFRPFIFWGSFALAVSGALVFLPIPTAPTSIKIIAMVAGYFVWDLAYTVVNVPYGSMASVITDDPVQRSSLSKYRTIGAMIANLPVQILLPMLIYRDRLDESGNVIYNNGTKVQDFLGLNVFFIALGLGVIGLLSFLFYLKYTVERVEPAHKEAKEKVNILKVFGSFFKNRAAVGLTIASMFSLIMMQGITTASTIVYKDFFGKADLSGVISMIAYLPMLGVVFFVDPIVKKFGKQLASGYPAIVGVVAGLLMAFVPIKNDMAGLVFWVVCQVLITASLAVFSVIGWAMVADCIDYQEIQTGHREEGTVYAVYSLGRKFAQGIGASVVLFIMGLIGFVSAENGVTPVQTPETVQNIKIMIGLVYAICCLFVFVSIVFIYNISKEKVKEMQIKLGRVNDIHTEHPED